MLAWAPTQGLLLFLGAHHCLALTPLHPDDLLLLGKPITLITTAPEPPLDDLPLMGLLCVQQPASHPAGSRLTLQNVPVPQQLVISPTAGARRAAGASPAHAHVCAQLSVPPLDPMSQRPPRTWVSGGLRLHFPPRPSQRMSSHSSEDQRCVVPLHQLSLFSGWKNSAQ